MIIAKFPLKMVRACLKYPLSRASFKNNQYFAAQVVFGRLAPAFPLRARVNYDKFL